MRVGLKLLQRKKKWQLLNFVVGQAKLSSYESRKNQIENVSGEELLLIIMMNNVDEFLSQWCFSKALCSVAEGKLRFNSVSMTLFQTYIFISVSSGNHVMLRLSLFIGK